MQSRSLRLVLSAASLLFGLLLAEVGLRLARQVSPRLDHLLSPAYERRLVADPALGHRFSPYTLGHDARGYRNEEGRNETDILAVGDSYTYGWAAESSGSWPRVLEALSGRSVYNAGVVGYGFCEYEQVVDELMALDPELVILGVFTMNDLGDTYRAVYVDGRCPHLVTEDEELLRSLRRLDERETIAEAAERLGWGGEVASRAPPTGLLGILRRRASARSSLYGLAREIRARLSTARSEASAPDFASASRLANVVPFDEVPELRTVFKSPDMMSLTVNLDDPRIAEGFRIAQLVLGRLNERLTAAGVELAVVIIPGKYRAYAPFVASAPGVPESFATLVNFDQRIADMFAESLHRESIPYVDVTDALRARAAEGVPIFPETDEHHNSAEGYRVIAVEIAGELLGTGSGRG